MKVCILGAGVIGLNTVSEFQKQFPNASVTIIADKYNEETTSDGAAGLILPANNFKGPSSEISKQWMVDSFNYYKNLMENPTMPSGGVTWVSGYLLSNESQAVCENEYMKLVSPDYRKVKKEELNKKLDGNFKYGVYMSSMVVSCRKLLPWFLKSFKENGVTIIKNKVNQLSSLTETYDVIFNCSGLGAKYLCHRQDTELIPIRGQVVQIKDPLIKNFYVYDMISYIIPCGYDNLITLGGTQDYGSFETEVDPFISNSIIDRCSRFVPSVRNAEIVRTWVGHRPHRPSVRVEIEKYKNATVIHHYGHGGYGVTTGPGSAKYVVNLFLESFRSSGQSKL